MKVEDYLERIGYRGGREPSAANLAALVKAHRLAVPYETLDLWRGRHVTLATEEVLALARFDSRGKMGLTFLRSEAALLKTLRDEFGIVEAGVV